MWYALNKNGYTIKVKKMTSEAGNLKIALYKLDSCDNSRTLVGTAKESTGSEIQIDLPKFEAPDKTKPCSNTGSNTPQTVFELNKSGLYELDINVGDRLNDKIQFPHYPLLLKDIVKDIEKYLCGCKCKDCGKGDCIEDGKILVDVAFKAMLYYTLSGKFYQNIYSRAVGCIGCGLDDYAICMIMNQLVTGKSNNTKYLKKLIALLYLVFYFTENRINCDKTFINDVFSIEDIKHCLIEIGVDFNCVRNSIYEDAVTTGDFHLCAIQGEDTIIGKKTFIESSPLYNDIYNRYIVKIKIFDITMQGTAPNKDKLLLNNVDVVENQEIDFSDIEANKLVYRPADTARCSISTFKWVVTEFCE